MSRFVASVALLLGLSALGCGGAEGSGGASSSAGGSGTSDEGATSGAGGDTTSAGSGGASSGGGASQGAGAMGTGAMGMGGMGVAGGSPIDGYGALGGSCGDIDLEDLVSPNPELLESTLDFTLEGALVSSDLTPGGQEILAAGNLGGSSLYSEIFAFEALHRCDGAELLKTEAEISYAIQGKKTDLLVNIDATKVGVSVVRAMSYPEGAPYPTSQAKTVLEGKLADILQSSANVAPADAWEKQILAVIAQTPDHATAIAEAWNQIDPAIRADTIVFVTVTEGTDGFIYYGM